MLMMLPFEAPTIFEGIHKSYFRMPRVVKDQRSKFENDDLFRQLSHESAVKYTGFKDRPLEERQMKFIANCQEGHTEVSVVQSGNQFTLMFNPTANPAYNNEGCDFDKEHGKVHIKSGFILNGVCVLWRGWIDLNRLEGFGCLEFDEYRAYLEDAMLKQQIDKQQTCNTNHQPSPLGRLNHHHSQLGHQLNPATAAVAAAAAALGPIGLSTQCLAPQQQQQQQQQPPQAPPASQQQAATSLPGLQQQPLPASVSLADSAAHYGNAAIAAAAAAAFHQALGVGAPPPPQSLHGLGPVQSAVTAASGPPQLPPSLPLVPVSQQQQPTHHPQSHLNSYQSNGGIQNGLSSQLIPPNAATVAALAAVGHHHNHHHSHHHHPQQQQQLHNHHNHQQQRHSPPEAQSHLSQQTNGSGNTPNGSSRRSPPERDLSHRLASKRSLEPDQTQLDDVDVVSDIHAHELDFPPRRMFKSTPITTGQHHRQTRRA